MQFNVCIIEDESVCAEHAEKCLRDWAKRNQCRIEIHIFSSGEELMGEKEDFGYQIFFIDIMLKRINGLKVAEYLREHHYEGEIVFLTSFQEYAIDGYHVHALDYILKPVTPEKINDCMEHLLSKYTEENYKYSYRREIKNIPYRNIIYFASSGHNIDIITTTGEYQQPKSFRELKGEQLPVQFLQCNRGIIINIGHVVQLRKQEVVLTNGMILPVSVSYAEKLQEAFFRYAF